MSLLRHGPARTELARPRIPLPHGRPDSQTESEQRHGQEAHDKKPKAGGGFFVWAQGMYLYGLKIHYDQRTNFFTQQPRNAEHPAAATRKVACRNGRHANRKLSAGIGIAVHSRGE